MHFFVKNVIHETAKKKERRELTAKDILLNVTVANKIILRTLMKSNK